MPSILLLLCYPHRHWRRRCDCMYPTMKLMWQTTVYSLLNRINFTREKIILDFCRARARSRDMCVLICHHEQSAHYTYYYYYYYSFRHAHRSMIRISFRNACSRLAQLELIQYSTTHRRINKHTISGTKFKAPLCGNVREHSGWIHGNYM